MSRLRQFTQGVASSWMATFVTVIYSLLSVPLALRHLSVDEFGLLMLLLQVAAYFNLVDLGMTASTARILIDHKDQPREGRYGSVILAGGAVCLCQGLIILALGWLSAPTIVRAFSIATEYIGVAEYLLRWLAATFAIGAVFRIFSSVLYANRRIDLVALLMSLVPLLGLAIMWLVLSAGLGLRGMAWAFVVPSIVAGLSAAVAVGWLGLLPKRGHWCAPSWLEFHEMFVLGKDMFLINVGNQVLEASQLMIVTRTMGLGAAAVWSVSTKLFALVFQLVTKIEGTAIVFFSEMMVRGERDRLTLRFRNIYQLTAGVSVTALAVVAAVNTPFVTLWAGPSLVWPWGLGLLLGIVTYLNCITKCQTDLIMHSKQIRGLRYVFFFEAVGFVVLAVFLSRHIGFTGVLVSAISCAVVFRGCYIVRRTSAYFGVPVRTVGWTWLRRSLLSAAALLPFVLAAPKVAGLFSPPWLQLTISVLWIAAPATAVLATITLPRELREEIFSRLHLHGRIANT